MKRVLHLFFFPLNASTMPLAETSQEQQSVTVSTGKWTVELTVCLMHELCFCRL